MRLKLEYLPWDTDHFGVSIGRVVLNGASPEDIVRVEEEARSRGIECFYAFLDPAELALGQYVQSRGWRFVEASTMFDLRVSEPKIPRPPDTEIRLGVPADRDRLLPLADVMAEWSRFAVDDRFGMDAATGMQRAWLDRALNDGSEMHSLAVAEQHGEIVAFVGRVHEPARADAVGTTRRGTGAARYLIEIARSLAGDQPLLGGPIAARNVAALRYVSHCNYRVCGVEYVYHCWIDELKDPTP